MMWQVASGILISAGVLAIIAVGIIVGISLSNDNENSAPGWLIVLVGVGIAAWIVIAHWPAQRY